MDRTAAEELFAEFARYTIGDEELVRDQLSKLIRKKLIVGGLGNIIQLTPRGAEECRLDDQNASGRL